MKKSVQVSISRCSDCPNHNNSWKLVKRSPDLKSVCGHPKAMGREFDPASTEEIQDWCPLENA